MIYSIITHPFGSHFSNKIWQSKRKATCLFFLLYCLITTQAQTTTHQFKGTVLCEETGESLTGVNIFSRDKSVGTTSDENGKFSFTLKKQETKLQFSFIGYKTRITSISDSTKTELIIYLQPDNFAIKEVMITSTRNKQSSYEQTTPVSSINSTRIYESQAQNLPEFISDAPAVSLVGAGYHKSVSIRGLARKRALILIDGHRISSERNAGPPGSFINPLAIKRVEILRGPYSTLYGSDAVGGVVNILTKDYQPGLTNNYIGGIFDINYRSINQGYNSNLLLSGKLGENIKLQVIAGKRKANSYKDAKGNEVMSTNYSEQNISTKLSWQINKNHKLILNGLISRADSIGKPAFSDKINALHPNDDHSRIALQYNWIRSGKTFSEMNINTAFHKHDITARVYNYMNTDYGRVVNKQKNLYNNDISYQHDFRFTFSKTLSLLSGLDIYQRDGIHVDEQTRAYEYIPGNNSSIGEMLYLSSQDTTLHDSYQRSGGCFAQFNYNPTEKFHFNIGGRYNLFKTLANLTIKNTYAGPPYDYTLNKKERHKKSDAAFSGNFGALYSPTKQFKLTFNIGQAFRTPSTKELFINTLTPGGVNISNPNLKPEQSLNLDLGIKHVSKNYDFVSLAFFRNDINNMIILQWDSLHSSGEFKNSNAFLYGAELEFKQHISKRFFSCGNIAYVSGTQESGEPLIDIPPFQMNFRLSYDILENKLRTSINAKYSASQNKLATGDIPTKEYFVYDFFSSWRINRNIYLSLSVTNIFNNYYREHHQFDWVRQAGRSFNTGLKIKF